MRKPNIIALPTSQMQALCDVLGLGREVQKSTASMIEALEAVDWAEVKPKTVKFKLDVLPKDIVAIRKANLGITDEDEPSDEPTTDD